MRDSSVLFQALDKRRQAIHSLLRSTSELSVELTRLVRQSRGDLAPALTHLSSVVDVLNKDSDDIDQSLRLMAPVLPGLRQHARQRAVVRHLHPEHPAGAAGGWLRWGPV